MKQNKLPLLLTGIVFFLALFYLFFIKPQSVSQTNQMQTNLKDALIANVTVTIPELDPVTTVKLTGDTTDFTAPGEATGMPGGTVTVVGDVVGNDDSPFAILAVNTGGSGEFFYLVAFEKTDMGYVSKGFAPLDDRIKLQSLSYTTPNIVEVSYLTHGPDQAMVDAPTVDVFDSFTYSDGTFTKDSE